MSEKLTKLINQAEKVLNSENVKKEAMERTTKILSKIPELTDEIPSQLVNLFTNKDALKGLKNGLVPEMEERGIASFTDDNDLITVFDEKMFKKYTKLKKKLKMGMELAEVFNPENQESVNGVAELMKDIKELCEKIYE